MILNVLIMKVIIINGPNLNLLGTRNKSIYGTVSFEDYFQTLKSHFNSIDLVYYQSNIEGDLINKLQEVGFSYDYIILNAGGYSHSSVSIADSISTPLNKDSHLTGKMQKEEPTLSEFERVNLPG